MYIYIYIVARACLRAWWMIFTHGSVQAALRSYFLASKVIHDMDVQSHYLVQVNQSRTKRAPEFSKIHMISYERPYDELERDIVVTQFLHA